MIFGRALRAIMFVVNVRMVICGNTIRHQPLLFLAIIALLILGYFSAYQNIFVPLGDAFHDNLVEMSSGNNRLNALRLVTCVDVIPLSLLAPGFFGALLNTLKWDVAVKMLHNRCRNEWVVLSVAFFDLCMSWISIQVLLSPVLWLPVVTELKMEESVRRVAVFGIVFLVGLIFSLVWLNVVLRLEATNRPITWLWIATAVFYLLFFLAGRVVRSTLAGSPSQNSIVVKIIDLPHTAPWLGVLGLIAILLGGAWLAAWGVCEGMRKAGDI